MINERFKEDSYEQALIELFKSLEGKQYRYEYGPDIVTSLYIQINNNELIFHRLATLRDTLLPRLTSGELKVNETEQLHLRVD